ncbi:MAG: 50S ribosomal protein L4 [Gemmatimonadetes bacterium]|nr:50S ribosomal protein L4 [Gemmatimonadota bacterium]
MATTLKAPVFSAAGERTGEKKLPTSLFDGSVHEPAMWQTVKAYLSNQRQATASTKKRGEVSGGNRKPWRQKGTGRARQGSIRSPQWRGGGIVFGPRPERNYRQDVPKQVRWLARRSAYNARAQDGAVLLIESFELAAPKTKAIVALLEKAGAQGNVLILTHGPQPIVYRSARNLPGVQVRPFGQESAYDVLWADTVIIEAPALERAEEVAHA